MVQAKEFITQQLESIVQKLAGEAVEVHLEIPQSVSHGDYSSNIALILSKKLGKSPKEVAESIKDKLNTEYSILNTIDKVETAGPGFLNFFLSKEVLFKNLENILAQKEKYGSSNVRTNMRLMVEFTHANTHKEFHIGHLRNITIGESLVRILSSQGADVSRVNYQGDVGMHVAKALYGVLKKLETEGKTLESVRQEAPGEKAKFLGEGYVLGSKFYEEDKVAKEKIGVINKQIYAKNPEILSLWEETRKWSLEYFESIYKRVGTTFDRFFFESEVFDAGREIVRAHIKDGIFLEDEGAVIFPGEKYGLHNRVFVTSEGNPTYEGKEMGLGPLQYQEFHFDLALHVVGSEQAGYFKVVFKALEMVNSELVGREKHVVYGFVQLKDGKMSSRLGNIVRGEWLLDEAKKRILESFSDISPEIAEQIAVGAVKYSMLKVGREANIQFSFEDSINLHGNSGPYLQYAYARTQSVLGKIQNQNTESKIEPKNVKVEKEEEDLLRTLNHFPEIVSGAAEKFAPNIITTYLFDLSQKFSIFYEKHKIVGSDNEEFRLGLTAGVGQVLKNGLNLLGISAPEKI